MTALKFISVGNSVGVLFPKDLLALFGAKKGDVVHVSQLAGGDLRLSLLDKDVAAEVEQGEAFMDRYRETFRALAK